jgi:hypothetical protein
MKYERMKEVVKEIETLQKELSGIKEFIDNNATEGKEVSRVDIFYKGNNGDYLYIYRESPVFEKLIDAIGDVCLERHGEIISRIKALENEDLLCVQQKGE